MLNQKLTIGVLCTTIILAGCSAGSVLPDKGAKVNLKCEVKTNQRSSAATVFAFTIDEKNNDAFIQYASGQSLPIGVAFSAEDVTLTLKEASAMEDAMRSHGNYFGGTQYGGSFDSFGGTKTTFIINRVSGELTYKQLIMGKRQQEAPSIGICTRK